MCSWQTHWHTATQLVQLHQRTMSESFLELWCNDGSLWTKISFYPLCKECISGSLQYRLQHLKILEVEWFSENLMLLSDVHEIVFRLFGFNQQMQMQFYCILFGSPNMPQSFYDVDTLKSWNCFWLLNIKTKSQIIPNPWL